MSLCPPQRFKSTIKFQKIKWENVGLLPPGQSPFPKVLNDQQQAFVDQALAIYQERQGKSPA
jgi:hypothetical protein